MGVNVLPLAVMVTASVKHIIDVVEVVRFTDLAPTCSNVVPGVIEKKIGVWSIFRT